MQKELILCLLSVEQNSLHCPNQKQSLIKRIRWTGSLVDWVELVYSLHCVGCFNDGKETLTNLFLALGDIFDFKIQRFSRTFVDVKTRSKGEGTVFLDKMKKALLRKIEEVEKKYERRMRR